ncbi:MAG: alpha/beta superfamily hydrolase [Haloplasmataceae bacterium]|nr:alpha/beta superfamily hydrolase [Haloplasmataceae bacterium]
MNYWIEVEPNVKIFVNVLNPEGRKTILFLHGWPLSQKAFEYQYNILPSMGYRCIGIDTRGFGNSDKPWENYDYNRLADDIKIVIDSLKLQDVTLVGHSTGGAIAVRYMSRYNGWGVSKLVLIAAAAPSLIQRPYFPYGLTKEAVIDIINGTYKDRPKMLSDFCNIFLFKFSSIPLQNWFFQMGLEAASWATIAIAMNWINDEGLFSDLGKINVPTLILHGVQDKVCLFPLIAQNQAIKNSKLVAFELGGHGVFYEEFEKVNQEIIQFVG